MPLNTPALQSAIKAAFLANLPSADPGQIAQVATMATAIAVAMEAFVMSATITYTSGLVAPGSGGPVTGIFNNTIS